MSGSANISPSRNFADWSKKKYVSGKLSFRWHSSCLFKRNEMRVDGSLHRDIEFKEVYLFSTMRFPPRPFAKWKCGERMNTALAASILWHFWLFLNIWFYKICVIPFSKCIHLGLQQVNGKQKKISPLELSRPQWKIVLQYNQIIFCYMQHMIGFSVC